MNFILAHEYLGLIFGNEICSLSQIGATSGAKKDTGDSRPSSDQHENETK